MLQMEFDQMLKSCKSLPSKNYKSLNRFCQKLNFKGIKLPLKNRDIHKHEKRIPSTLVSLVMKIKEKHPMYVSNKCCKEKHIDLLLMRKKKQKTMLLLKTLILSCIIILYIMKKTFSLLLFISF